MHEKTPPPLLALLGVLALAAVCTACASDETTTPSESTGLQAESRKSEVDRLERKLKRLRRSDPGATAPQRQPGFGELAKSLPGEVGLVLGPPAAGEVLSHGDLVSGPAWSTIKVPIALAVLQVAGGPSGLSSDQRGQLRQAITESDNDAAADLFASLGNQSMATDAVTEVLRAAGDDETMVSTVGRDGFSPYGQTDWSLAAQHRFMSATARGCPVSRPSSRYVLDLMGQVTSDTWGLGSAGVPAQWKGGWGPDPDGRYIVRQMGLLEVDDRQLVVTLAARSNDGSLESAQQLATRLATWAAENGRSLAADAEPC